MGTFFIILAVISAFIGGYQFCLLRWRPRDLCKVTKIMTDMTSNEISPEEALKRVKEITF